MEATTTRWMFKRIFPLGLFRLIPERPIKKVITQAEQDRLDAQRYRKLKEAFQYQYNVKIDELFEYLLNNFDSAVDALPEPENMAGKTK